MHWFFLVLSNFFFSIASGQAPSPVGDPATMGRGTYPRAIRLQSENALLGVYTAFRNGNNVLTVVKSSDSGSSWFEIGTVAQRPSASSDLDNPYVHELPSGDILCAYRNHDGRAPDWTYYRIDISISRDGGVSWEFFRNIDNYPADPDQANGIWEPLFLQVDSQLQLYYSRETANNDQDSILRTSDNDGADWSPERTITGQSITSRDGMLGVSQSGDTLTAVYETLVNGVFTVLMSQSPDRGDTWPRSSRQTIYEAPGFNAGNPKIAAVGDRLVVTLNTNKDGGDWPQGETVLIVSRNGGDTWGDETVVAGPISLWSGVLALDDTEFLVLYEDLDAGEVQAQRFTF